MKKVKLKSVVFAVITLSLSTLLAFSFEQFGLRRENILLVYVVAVMFIMVETRNFYMGMISTLFLVFIFNFFFTEPKYSFIIDDPNYIITLVIFSIAVIILGTLTNSLQREIHTSKDNENKIALLYSTNKELLNSGGMSDSLLIVEKNLSSILNRQVYFVFIHPKISEHTYDDQNHQKEIEYAVNNHLICGFNESKYSDLTIKIYPMNNNKGIRGVLMIPVFEHDLTRQEKELVQTILIQLMTSLEKEKLAHEQENARLEIEKEKLKNMLLRSISHDLKTPLTTLQSGTSFIYDSYESISDETKKDLLLDINNETSRLSEFVENLLNMTRLNANQLKLNLKNELIDDIFSDVHQRIIRRIGKHQITFQQHDALDYVCTDAPLLIQVITNLVDNAIRHTEDASSIEINYQIINHGVEFSIIDDGGGIDPSALPFIFSDFTSFEKHRGDKTRGTGLGLSICRSIIQAHGGIITATNNDKGGATFTFNIPNPKEETV